jgi:hypothetical protein
MSNERPKETEKNAAQLIRAVIVPCEQKVEKIQVVVVPVEQKVEKIRMWVSLPSDRVHGGGDDRDAKDALAKARQELVAEALKKIRRLDNQYTNLPELDPLFDAIKKLVDEYGAKQKQAGAT